MKFKEYYKNRSIQQYKQNILEVIESSKRLLSDISSKKDKWLKDKIENHRGRTGINDDLNTILQTIINSELSASYFCKSATKQNSSEKCQIDFLKTRGIEIENLSAGGRGSWRFVSETGEFFQTPKEEGKTSHSLDFRCTTKNYDYFLMAKLTTTQGGGQNQQRQEMLDIIDDIKLYYKNNTNSNKRFVLLLDGDSYEGNGILPFVEKAKSDNRILIRNSDTFNVE